MSSYTLPALLLVPVTGYLADRFGKKLILFPSLVIFGLCGGLVSLASNIETLICLRFIQGIGGSALVTFSTALIPDLFSGSDRIKIMGYVGATQGIGSGLLPLVGGLLASITWFFPFMTALIALPVGIYMLSTLQSLESDLNPKNKHYLYHAWTHLADRRVIELCFFIFGFIFVGFGCFVSYIPSFMNYSFGNGPALIGVIISARAITGALTSVFLVQAMQLFSGRALISFLLYNFSNRNGVTSCCHWPLGNIVLSPLLWSWIWGNPTSHTGSPVRDCAKRFTCHFFICQWHGTSASPNIITVCCWIDDCLIRL